MARLVVTPGDPRGIGPEVILRALDSFREQHPDADVVIVGPDGPMSPADLLELATAHRARDRGRHGADAAAGAVAAGSIERGVDMTRNGTAHAVVTAPLHKPSLHAAGWVVPGQTEMLASLAGAGRVGMLMAAESTRLGPPLRVLLATTHIPLRDVVHSVTTECLTEQTELLFKSLRDDWGIAEPRVALCALNPHASDNGLFGDEEERVYGPSLRRLQDLGIEAVGPVPADTVFARALGGEFDAVVAPYHDVGMAAFKTTTFGSGVNVTLGLPFIRTSPDHGTAFDIAGSGRADPSSMKEALNLAYMLATKRFDTNFAHV